MLHGIAFVLSSSHLFFHNISLFSVQIKILLGMFTLSLLYGTECSTEKMISGHETFYSSSNIKIPKPLFFIEKNEKENSTSIDYSDTI